MEKEKIDTVKRVRQKDLLWYNNDVRWQLHSVLVVKR